VRRKQREEISENSDEKKAKRAIMRKKHSDKKATINK